MVRVQIERRGISDARVLSAMRKVPRHLFFSQIDLDNAYRDSPAPIGFGQTISQPYIVGLMTQLLQTSESDTILEIGTGSGYQAAVLSLLVKKVISLEIIPQLAEKANNIFEQLGYTNIDVHCLDGSGGYPASLPYQGILVTACAPITPQQLLDQLSPGARMVLPVEVSGRQVLRIWDKDKQGTLSYLDHIPVAFVPLRGKFRFPYQ